MPDRPSDPAIWFPAIRAGSGADIYTERLARGLTDRGIQAEITWLPHHAEYAPFAVHSPKPPKWANIIHINSWLHQKFLPNGFPIISSMYHCILDPSLRPYKSIPQMIYHDYWIGNIEKRALNASNRIIAISKYSAETTRSIYKLNTEIDVVPIGIDLEIFSPKKKEPNKIFKILFVGNWSSRKGIDLLEPIMNTLGPKYKLYILAGLRNKLPFYQSTNIEVLPPIPNDTEMAALYRSCDALLFPTRLEGFGLAALEAHACGLPVIATNCSSLPEVVEDGVSGFLCEKDNIEAFAAAVRQLAENSIIYNQMSKNARSRAIRLFDINSMITRHIEIYNEVAKNNANSAYPNN